MPPTFNGHLSTSQDSHRPIILSISHHGVQFFETNTQVTRLSTDVIQVVASDDFIDQFVSREQFVNMKSETLTVPVRMQTI